MARFWKDFGRIFRGFFAFSLKAPIFKIRAPTQCFVRVELLKIQQKIRKNRHKIDAIFRCEKKGSKFTQKVDLGGSWAPFGKGLGRSGASFGRSWALFGSFFGLLNTSSIMILPKMGSKGASGSILGGICKDFGRIWEGFGQNFFHVGLH